MVSYTMGAMFSGIPRAQSLTMYETITLIKDSFCIESKKESPTNIVSAYARNTFPELFWCNILFPLRAPFCYVAFVTVFNIL